MFSWTEFLTPLREDRFSDMAAWTAGKHVAVLGGGSTAIDCAETALRLGARDVSLVYRRSFREMPADEDHRIRALRAGVQFLPLNQPTGYAQDGQGRLTALRLVRTRLGEPDAGGRRAPVEVPGTDWALDVDVVVEAIGARPDPESADGCPAVAVDRNGLIVADGETGETPVKRVHAGGDAVRGPALVVHAVRDGKAAARAIARALGGR